LVLVILDCTGGHRVVPKGFRGGKGKKDFGCENGPQLFIIHGFVSVKEEWRHLLGPSSSRAEVGRLHWCDTAYKRRSQIMHSIEQIMTDMKGEKEQTDVSEPIIVCVCI
jgi:hypothetical protein